MGLRELLNTGRWSGEAINAGTTVTAPASVEVAPQIPQGAIIVTQDQLKEKKEALLAPVPEERKAEVQAALDSTPHLSFLLNHSKMLVGIAGTSEEHQPLIPVKVIYDIDRKIPWYLRDKAKPGNYTNMLLTIAQADDLDMLTRHYMHLAKELIELLPKTGIPPRLAEEIGASLLTEKITAKEEMYRLDEERLQWILGTGYHGLPYITDEFSDTIFKFSNHENKHLIADLVGKIVKDRISYYHMMDSFHGNAGVKIEFLSNALRQLGDIYKDLDPAITKEKLMAVAAFSSAMDIDGFDLNYLMKSKFGELLLEEPEKCQQIINALKGITDFILFNLSGVFHEREMWKATDSDPVMEEKRFNLIFHEKFDEFMDILNSSSGDKERENIFEYVTLNLETVLDNAAFFKELFVAENSEKLPVSLYEYDAETWLDLAGILGSAKAAEKTAGAVSWVDREGKRFAIANGTEYEMGRKC